MLTVLLPIFTRLFSSSSCVTVLFRSCCSSVKCSSASARWFSRLQDQIPAVAELHRFILCTRHSGGTAHEGGGATSQLDLPSLTPLYVAGCGRLQLVVPH